MLTRKEYKSGKLRKLILNIIGSFAIVGVVTALIFVSLYFLGDKQIKLEKVQAISENIVEQEVEVTYDTDYNTYDFSEINLVETVSYSEMKNNQAIAYVVYYYGDNEVSKSFINTTENAIKRANISIYAVNVSQLSKEDKKEVENKYELDGTNPYLFKVNNGEVISRTQTGDMIEMENWLNSHKYN